MVRVEIEMNAKAVIISVNLILKTSILLDIVFSYSISLNVSLKRVRVFLFKNVIIIRGIRPSSKRLEVAYVLKREDWPKEFKVQYLLVKFNEPDSLTTSTAEYAGLLTMTGIKKQIKRFALIEQNTHSLYFDKFTLS